jgi:hypothetical protein
MHHNTALRLPLAFDPERLRRDLAICEAEHWAQHFNQRDYAGEWTGIALRSATGQAADIHATPAHSSAYVDTPLLARCDYFRAILEDFHCEKETARLLSLTPGSEIKEHRDLGLGYPHGTFRLHIPIETDEGVRFRVAGHDLPMQAGECWYADFDQPHSVLHQGERRRVHLVFDCQRNAWSDELFSRAGYRFETEKNAARYDTGTLAQIIAELEKMDTDAARALIAQLHTNASAAPVPNDWSEWIPSRITATPDGPQVQWTYLNGKKFVEPFFENTLAKCRSNAHNAGLLRPSGSLEFLLEASQKIEFVAPTAFIFHVSRCGSTLLSQLLSLDDSNIVAAEVPLFDEILKMPFGKFEQTDSDQSEALLAAAIRFLGQKRSGRETRFFVKLDSWHLFFYPIFRKKYPETPFFLLTRRPDEVLRSHQKQRGLQAIPGYLDAPMFAPDAPPDADNGWEHYFCQVLARYYAAMEQIVAQDTNAQLMDYAEGPSQLLQQLAAHTGWNWDADLSARIAERSQYHAKHPHEIFQEQPVEMADAPALAAAFEAYRRLKRAGLKI